MGRGEKVSSKCSRREQVWKQNVISDDSDEDYQVEEDETDDQSDDLVSLVGDASEEDGFSGFVEEEEEVVVAVRRVPKSKAQKGSSPRKNGMKRSTKRNSMAYDDDDYDEDENEEDEDEDYDEYDEEFTPDDLDSMDEEEEFPSSKGKIKINGWCTVKRKGSSKSGRRKTCTKTVRKPPKKKRKRSTQTRNKATCGNNRNYMLKVTTSRGKCKRKPVLRKKKTKPCFDSDFVSSDSSDYEFTISEEEQEQVREANEFCRRVNSSLRTSKRVLEDATCDQPRTLTERKGKEKVEDAKGDVGKPVCGICFTEEGKNTVRGTLNCCCHFFCFACIMEWSKVESRCPLCKQRFSTISKPARSATRLDLRDVAIHVPERDQVYQPSEEELRNYLDPYENMICTECHEGGDDALMLLCDLCDSPAHTYCVGLGHEVPEDNWYCEGCRPAVGTTHSQAQDHTPAQRASTATVLNEPSSTYENMAEIDLNVSIPETPMTPLNRFLSSPRNQGVNLQPSASVSGVGVSTLSGRRRVHRFQYLLSSNRLSQMAGIADRSSTSATRAVSLGSQVDKANELSFFENRISDVVTSGHSLYADRLEENPFGPTQSRENFPGRPSLIRGHVLPSSADGTVNGCLQWGRGANGFHFGLNGISGHEHLQQCSSKLNWGSETTTSSLHPLQNGDVDHQAVKRQLQSMVKSHLKSFFRDMDSGETFKQIARSSTHTVLAACGLDHQRNEVCEIPPPMCSHSGEAWALAGGQTSPVKSCCRSCFDSFVRDAVRTIVNLRAPQWLGR